MLTIILVEVEELKTRHNSTWLKAYLCTITVIKIPTMRPKIGMLRNSWYSAIASLSTEPLKTLKPSDRSPSDIMKRYWKFAISWKFSNFIPEKEPLQGFWAQSTRPFLVSWFLFCKNYRGAAAFMCVYSSERFIQDLFQIRTIVSAKRWMPLSSKLLFWGERSLDIIEDISYEKLVKKEL